MIKKITLLALILFFSSLLAGENNFIKVIKTGKSYKFEIPDSLLGRDILFGSRIVDISSPSAKVYSAGQMRRPPVLIRFAKRDKLIVIEQITNFVEKEINDPINEVLERNMRVGGVTFFEIESRNSENRSSIIDVTKYFSEEVQLAWPLPDNVKKGRLESKLSSIQFMKELEDRVNIRSYYEFTGGKETFTITVQYFMLLLPIEPMMPRVNDDRVGYQPYNRKSYLSGNSITTNRYISRWRVEPSPADMEAHANGGVVNPKNPITVYIEPYFPKEWIPYIKLGIEDWNRAFEKIGFRDVLIAKEFPDDPDFDPYDIKTNAIRYIPVEEANAAGQTWTDPRSGEIINGEVLWWNNVVNLITMWRFTQTAAVDPQARSLKYSTEMMGEMVRYAIAHEVGHMLGLQHNMRSSYAYPVDSLRSPTFTSQFGTTASIMDYARNNHIARPGDLERGVKLTPPLLGPYDYLSIEYGYKYLHSAKEPKDEIRALDSLFTSKGGDPQYLFAPFIASPISPDPSAQSESLGDNVLISSKNGILNTRVILDSLIKWTVDAGGGVREIESRYEALSRQYFRYISLSMSYIGGVYVIQGPLESNSIKYFPVDPERQHEALKFAIRELRDAPIYLDRSDITSVSGSLTDGILKRQGEVLSSLLNNFILPRVLNNSTPNENGYELNQYLKDLDNLIWESSKGCNIYDKNIQIAYVLALTSLSKREGRESASGSQLIINEASFSQITRTKDRLRRAKNRDRKNREHYEYLLDIIEKG
ncbi:MAG: zinc-dependent metalloprotease [Bacteroidales bacterium]|nr:zinc-dependent metalloprotease [Bacteroidales bacterium]